MNTLKSIEEVIKFSTREPASKQRTQTLEVLCNLRQRIEDDFYAVQLAILQQFKKFKNFP